jgi:hypothetical protein
VVLPVSSPADSSPAAVDSPFGMVESTAAAAIATYSIDSPSSVSFLLPSASVDSPSIDKISSDEDGSDKK